MHHALPGTVERYFAAQNRQDLDAMLACFLPTAAVHDEGREMRGAAAIRAWQDGVQQRYAPTVAPLSSTASADGIAVAAQVEGSFPGSPIRLTFRFGLAEDGRIRSLAIG